MILLIGNIIHKETNFYLLEIKEKGMAEYLPFSYTKNDLDTNQKVFVAIDICPTAPKIFIAKDVIPIEGEDTNLYTEFCYVQSNKLYTRYGVFLNHDVSKMKEGKYFVTGKYKSIYQKNDVKGFLPYILVESMVSL